VVDTARSKTALDDLETAAFAKHHIAGGDADILKRHVAVAVGCVVETHD
jgi:hypothetical protein